MQVTGSEAITFDNEQQFKQNSIHTLYRKSAQKVVAPQEFPVNKYLQNKTSNVIRDAKSGINKKQSDQNIIKHNFVLKLQK